MSIICLLIQFSFKSTTETSEYKAHVANVITLQCLSLFYITAAMFIALKVVHFCLEQMF